MKIPLRALALLAPAGLLAVLAPALAQDMADPIDPIEDQALREEAGAKFDAALETFRQAFGAAVEQAGSGAARERNLARAEVLLEKIDGLTESVSRQKATDAFLEGFDGEQLGPVLKAYVDWRRARYKLAAGDADGAAKLIAELGLVRD